VAVDNAARGRRGSSRNTVSCSIANTARGRSWDTVVLVHSAGGGGWDAVVLVDRAR
jgi:hypothetical protein